MFSSIFLPHYGFFFFEGCLSTIKIDRSEERGGGEKKNMLLDWSCVHPGKISLKYNLGFLRCSYSSQAAQRFIFLKPRRTDAYTHKSFWCLANIKNRISFIISNALSVPHPKASNYLICQPTMFDYNMNGCLWAPPLSVSGFPVVEIEI